jgi:uncharacterized protein YheU (UPF0270 family)
VPPSNLIEMPPDALSPEALRAVIEEYATCASTDYGMRERTIEEKIAEVRRQRERGDASTVFDVDTGTTNILPAREAAA